MGRLSPRCQRLIRTELRRRAPLRGMSKRAAHRIGASPTSYLAYVAGRNNIPEHIAWRILEQARQEDLELAAKIEAELNAPSALKECE
jgi:hypothetical protein